MYTALYRQWRPKTLAELVGQTHVTQTLRNALAQGRVGHAYLFCGPRGVGKTTVARALARALNCKAGAGPEPCGVCSACTSIMSGSSLDVLEIDAASNRGIDEIRDLREKVRFYPAECRYKVYIIDEVHMLTSEAFNALLKTLEEPPAHAIFILATTEAHKIPLTILSRCQRFDFHRLEPDEIIGRMSEILDSTGTKAEDSALSLIAKAADGSLRDALSVLDQALTMGDGHVKEETVLAILGVPDKMAVARAVRAVARADAGEIFGLIDSLLKNGKDLRQFSRDLGGYFRDLLLIETGARLGPKVSDSELSDMKMDAALFNRGFLIQALRTFAQSENEMRVSSWPRLTLETNLLGLMAQAQSLHQATQAPQPIQSPQPAKPADPGPSVTPQAVPAPTVSPAAQAAPKKAASHPHVPQAKPAPAQPVDLLGDEMPRPASADAAPPAKEPPKAAAALSIDDVKRSWPGIMDAIRKERMKLWAMLQEGKPTSVDTDTVVVSFKHQFHKNEVDTPDNKAIMDKVIKAYLKRPVQVRLDMVSPQKTKKDPTDDPLVRGALELFGGEIIPEDESTE